MENSYLKKRLKYYTGGNTDFSFDITQEQLEEEEFLNQLYNGSVIESPTIGNTYNVKYVGSTADSLLFEGGFKDYIRVDNKPQELKYFKSLDIGDKVELLVYHINNANYFIYGSIAQLYESKAHDTIKSLKEEQSISAYIKETTPAGYNVELEYDSIILPGFMPNTLAGINKLSDPDSIVGETFEVMIESFSRDEGTYIVSRRKYLKSLIPENIKKLKQKTIYNGFVTGTTDFGVFVEFSATENGPTCLTGMIHKSNIDPDWQNRLNEIQPGYEIQFYIKEIIKDSKIILTQILRETLWDTIRINQIITGRVKDMKQFGALVFLDEETIGLIHSSELEKSDRKLSENDEVEVKVIAIERTNRKIYLSIV